MSIYERLPNSLKEKEELSGGAVVEGLEVSLEDEGYIVSVGSGRLFWEDPGIVSFPEVKLDLRELEPIPGDYILGISNTVIEGVPTEEVEEAPLEFYDITLEGLFINPLYRPENLYKEEIPGVFRPQHVNAVLEITSGGGSTISSLKVFTEHPVVYDSVTLYPSEGSLTITPELPQSKLTLVFPDVETEVTRILVSGSLLPREKTSIKNSSILRLFLQPTGREQLESIPQERVNLVLINFNRSGRARIVRAFEKETPNFDITKHLTRFWDRELQSAYSLKDNYVERLLNPLSAYKEEYE